MSLTQDQIAGGQIQGGRNYQEDDFGYLDALDQPGSESEHTLLVLADGMGGHAAGDVAANHSVKAFMEAYSNVEGPISDRLQTCLHHANQVLEDDIANDPSLADMGCTLVGVVITDKGVQWVSVGDSPLYLFDGGKLRRINADHSMAPVLRNFVEIGRMTEEEAAQDRTRHMLRSALTGDEIKLIDISSQPLPLSSESLIVLASDGLDTLDELEVEAVIKRHMDEGPEAVKDALLAQVEAIGRPDQDNTTVIVYRPCHGPESEAAKEIAARSEFVNAETVRIATTRAAEPEPKPAPARVVEPPARTNNSTTMIAAAVAFALVIVTALLLLLAPCLVGVGSNCKAGPDPVDDEDVVIRRGDTDRGGYDGGGSSDGDSQIIERQDGGTSPKVLDGQGPRQIKTTIVAGGEGGGGSSVDIERPVQEVDISPDPRQSDPDPTPPAPTPTPTVRTPETDIPNNPIGVIQGEVRGSLNKKECERYLPAYEKAKETRTDVALPFNPPNAAEVERWARECKELLKPRRVRRIPRSG